MEAFNRYINPFDVKEGIDTLSNFVPEPHYLQLKSLCNEAYLKICTKTPLVYSILEIKAIIDEYEHLFDETEVWIRLYSAFDNFSFLYLEFCELKVLIEDYGILCKKAISSYNCLERKRWIENNAYLFKYLQERLQIQSTDFIQEESFIKIHQCSIMIYIKYLYKHIEFYKIYKAAVLNF